MRTKAVAVVALLIAMSFLCSADMAGSSADGGIVSGTGHGDGIDVLYITEDGIPRVQITLSKVPSSHVDVILTSDSDMQAFSNLEPLSVFAVGVRDLDLTDYHVEIQLTGSLDVYVECDMKVAVYYTVTFNANGGSGSMEQAFLPSGTHYVLPECGFKAPSGKTFSMWKAGGDDLAPGEQILLNGDKMVRAQWSDAAETDYLSIAIAAAMVALVVAVIAIVVTRRR